jgi:hypothetical protein
MNSGFGDRSSLVRHNPTANNKGLDVSVLITALVLLAAPTDFDGAFRHKPSPDGFHATARRGDNWGGRPRFGRPASVYTFDAPELDGFPLDICPSDVGIDGILRGRCGIPVANEFCRAHGFAEASDAPHEGGQGPTRQLSGEIVSHPWATTFRYITCLR